MAEAARKAYFESVQPRRKTPAPRLAEAADLARSSAVHDQHRQLEAAFTARNHHPRLRAISYSLLVLGSLGLWAVIIDAVIHVGRMFHP